MNKDMDCPYCEKSVEVCHDDGFGYEEDKNHEMECPHCEKNFVFRTFISFSYTPAKAECLNGAPHDLRESRTYPKRYSRMKCRNCDFVGPLSTERLAEILAEDSEHEAALTAKKGKQ